MSIRDILPGLRAVRDHCADIALAYIGPDVRLRLERYGIREVMKINAAEHIWAIRDAKLLAIAERAGGEGRAERIEPSPACPSCADLRSRLSAMLARREAFEEAAQIADEEAMRSVKPNGRAARKSRGIAKMIRLRAEEGAK